MPHRQRVSNSGVPMTPTTCFGCITKPGWSLKSMRIRYELGSSGVASVAELPTSSPVIRLSPWSPAAKLMKGDVQS
jgi:hypothetical protein